MSSLATPRQILQTLLPHLRVAARYAQQIQSQIRSWPAKDAGSNILAAALSDADLSIQTLVEVALLGSYPELAFFGEEREQSFNTKYFRATELTDENYLIALDPIDGTRYYLDGFDNYQIILSILNRDTYEAVLAVSPAQERYYFAVQDQGLYVGNLEQDLDDCQLLNLTEHQPQVLLGWGMGKLKSSLLERYQVIDIENCYSASVQFPNYNGFFSGDLVGWVTKRGKFIDSAALAFMAQEYGAIVTTLDGAVPPPLHTCEAQSYEGLIVANSLQVHQDLLLACKSKKQNI